MGTIRVVLADEHVGIRSALISFISHNGQGIEVVGEATNGQEAIQLCRECSPDVLLLDLKLPDMEGEEVVRQLQAEQSTVQILILSAFFSHFNTQSITELIGKGVISCMTKDEVPELLIPAILGVSNGESWFSPNAVKLLNSTSPE